MTKTNKIAKIIKIALVILALALLIPAMSKDAQAATKNGISYTKKTKTWNYYTKGKINKKFTSLAKYKGTWYFVQKGTVNFKKSGLVNFKGAQYFVQNGKVNFKKNGSYTQSGVVYTIKNGVATKKAATVKVASAMPAASNTATTTTNKSTSKNRLVISSVGINVGTYTAPINNLAASQKIVDAADSAAVMNNGYQTVIADHVHQGFTNLKNVKVGTTATFNGETYRCTLNTRAYNKGSELVDAKTGKGYYYTNFGGLTIYTCVYNSDQITLTQWVKA